VGHNKYGSIQQAGEIIQGQQPDKARDNISDDHPDQDAEQPQPPLVPDIEPGHDGKRSFDVHFGFGMYMGPVQVHLQWRDTAGALHTQDLQMTEGSHTLMLTGNAQEVPAR